MEILDRLFLDLRDFFLWNLIDGSRGRWSGMAMLLSVPADEMFVMKKAGS